MKHIWDGNWEQQPAPNQHIGVMSLSVILSFAKIPISCTETKLKARQVKLWIYPHLMCEILQKIIFSQFFIVYIILIPFLIDNNGLNFIQLFPLRRDFQKLWRKQTD